ncbi:hypothetical protein, partial [Enterobacter cloacae complex sp. 4DZ3-17B2]|uniref:hypothetical protein n=1 Tax=Enterobacter cloacae complex sp. 4DZ3-17B2 TaxID=2511990 RepID=UPI0013EC72F2
VGGHEVLNDIKCNDAKREFVFICKRLLYHTRAQNVMLRSSVRYIKESEINVDNFDFANEQATNDAPMLVNYLVSRLQQAMGNPSLQSEVQRQLCAHGILQAAHHDKRTPRKPPCETSKRGLSPIWEEEEDPYEGLKKFLLDDTSPSQRRIQEPPPK